MKTLQLRLHCCDH